MNYSKPEISIVELDVVDVILTSGETGNGDFVPGKDQTPPVPRTLEQNSYWDK